MVRGVAYEGIGLGCLVCYSLLLALVSDLRLISFRRFFLHPVFVGHKYSNDAVASFFGFVCSALLNFILFG
jgi:hypothetical protein